ncbi:ricin-type beta-trefoil lectin domain protein [Calothrix sp. UHCC 0171]|uniref:ricin-type beta-trefoil lectin domain protein n=1 Tax=Calothrix sp. UHCC 0171 TaxID=3110245 RepID=UPI002B211A80|nr:ricin-type beta-trefoil lectin domain protein [Calothrix sp. UHCC 0171]MEA5573014.1 ricin-type beta-trefoil lectin domain protein [Calothrix sp. UHCC 0171]
MSNNNHQTTSAKTKFVKSIEHKNPRNYQNMLNKICTFIGLMAAASTSIFVSALPASAQNWQTFSVREGMGLNTNNQFRRIDGQPRMSIYRLNNNDSDQQFQILPGSRGGVMLKHRSTGNCLNAYRTGNGSEINVWPCNPADLDQNWNLISVGDGFSLIQRVGTNRCVDTPTRDNQGRVHLWDCDRNNANQRWKSSSIIPSSAWRLPWLAGRTGTTTQGWHRDGYGMSSIDIGLPPGTPVVAPIDSTVVRQCNAGNNHRAILLQASNGQRYSMIHVTTANIWNGRTYRKGEQMGVVAGDKPRNSCAKSYGPHLHFGLPSQNLNIGGYTISPTFIPRSMTAQN